MLAEQIIRGVENWFTYLCIGIALGGMLGKAGRR